ncbi:MAG: 6-phosphogluconolactonase [Candidatus Tectomicrobia bacterium]|nr:6-phosphogluconolactonase [Candidatus Tectomicrobia bacterium]
MGDSQAEIRVCSSTEELSQQAAGEFVRLAQEAVQVGGRFTVALSGGSSPRSLYTLLSSDKFRDKVPWSKTHFFWGDERHVPPDHAESNYRMASETMLSKMPVPPENIRRIPSEKNAEQAADEYEATLRKFFGLAAGELPRFDLVLLGMGPDGHTASLFPGTWAVRETQRLVAWPYVDKFSTYRITMTPPVLNNAAYIIFFVGGAEKAETLRHVLHGDYQPDIYPSQTIKPTKGKLLWLVDKEAAARLT